MPERWSPLIFAFAVLYLALFHELGNMAFIGADEPRYARIAEEMNDRADYITPTLEGRPWLEKPPLLFWLEAASYKLFGVSEWSARFPVALLAAFTVFSTAFLAWRMAGLRAGLLAALILATSPLFFVYGRAASTDLPLVAGLTLALVSGYESRRLGTIRPAVIAGIGLGLAALAKGPVALILFAAVFGIYSLLSEAYPWNWKQTLAGTVAFAAVAVPWYWLAWVENGANFVATFWLNHNLARFLTPIHHHSLGFWYYLPVLLFGFFPWSVFLVSAFARLVKEARHRRESRESDGLFLWIWFGVALVFFSLSNSKLAGYILPVFPALAVLVGLEWDRLLDSDLLAHRWIRREVALLAALGVLIVVGLVVGFPLVYGSVPIGFALGLSLGVGLAAAVYYFYRRRLQSMFFGLVAGLTLFSALAYWLAAPVVDDFHSARDLSYEAFPLISRAQPLVLYRYFHHTALYYTDYRSTPEAVVDRQALQAYFAAHPQKRYLILTQKAGWQDLQDGFKIRLVRHLGNLYLVEVTVGEPFSSTLRLSLGVTNAVLVRGAAICGH